MASTTSSKRKYTNYVSKTSGRPKRVGPPPTRQVSLRFTHEQHRQLQEWAELYNTTMSNLVVRSVGKFIAWKRGDLKVTSEYFYVRLPDGTYHPPLHEVGYEFQDNASRFAQRTEGATVVRLHPVPNPR